MTDPKKNLMPKQVSALNTFWIVEYLQDHYPKIDFNDFLAKINQNHPYYLENLKTGKVELISREHLTNTEYWFSNKFMIDLYNVVQEKIPDPNLAYKIGSSAYKTQNILKTAVGVPLLGPQSLLKKIVKESKKYIRTKDTVVLANKPGYAVIRLIHYKDIIINDFAMDWHRGVFESYAKLAGATNINFKKICVDKGPAKIGDPGQGIWDFEITYDNPSFFNRILKALIFNIPIIKKEIEKANEIQEEHNEQILNRDRIIEEKTGALIKNQEKILLIKKRNTKLQLESLSAELTNTEERDKRSIAEDLHSSVSQTLRPCIVKLKNIIDLNEYNRTGLIETKDYLEQTVNSIRSLTFQLSPPVLHDFGLEAAIEWLVKDIHNRYNLNIKFSNQLKNKLTINETDKIDMFRTIRELTTNIIKHAKAENATIDLFLKDNVIYLKVEDDGIGFAPDLIPKKTVKNYGLHSVKRRLEILGGTFKINSTIGTGTTIFISIPTRDFNKTANNTKSFSK